MKLKKSYLRKIIKEELKRLLLELDPMDDDDPEHDDGDEGRGEDPERDAYWDKVVADRDERYRKNPPELGMKGARARRAKYDASRKGIGESKRRRLRRQQKRRRK